MHHLEIKHLRMIAAIAESSNMTKAAARLNISQSALSQQLKDIEDKLGGALFFRTRKVMVLTPVGTRLLQPARQIIQTIEEAELEIARSVSGEQGEMKVGVQCVFCYKWLPEAVRSFQEKFPNIELEIGTASDLVHDLESRKFDLVVTAATAPDERFTCLPLFADQLVCAMSAAHPLRAAAFVRYEDFGDSNLISHAEMAASRFYQGALKPRGIEPKRFMTVGQPQAMVEMVAAGFGLGIFPRWAINGSLAAHGIVTRPITKGGLAVTWFAAFLKGDRIPLCQQEFVRIVGRMNLEIRPEALAGKG
ncbi:MAG: LysR family transcriptional regulator [Desulfobulbaceae bacterium]|nr:LysR family transcriptional regulator [Desulfobulbaceae bacterium]